MPPRPEPSPSPGPDKTPPPSPAPSTGNTPDTYDDDEKASPYDRLRILLRNRQEAIGNNNASRLRRINRHITALLETHPNNDRMWEEAESAGFDTGDAIRETGGGTPSTGNADEGAGTGGSGGTSGTGGSGGNGRTSPSRPVNNRWLPGIKGRDFEVVRYNGKVYVKYRVAHAGNFTMRVPEDKFKAYGIKEDEGRQLTKAQFQKLNHFGNAADILVHGEERHPFRQWVDQVEALYGGTGMLKNKEVMRVFLEGYAKGWAPDVIQGKLRQTSWYNETTEYSRRWGFLSDAEKTGEINTIGNNIKDSLKQMYGENWLEHFPEFDKKWLNKKAKQIATGLLGATGSPTSAMELFIRNQTSRAEKIEGTPAWIAKQQRLAEQGEFLGRPEDVREALRQQAIRELGYAGKDARIDGETLTQWAERIAYNQVNEEGNPYTQADFDQYLRRQKKALFPYLDPDEAWQDAASPYKARAEQILGTSLSWDDGLLSDLAAKDETGNLTGSRLSDWDFERMARKDTRFWDSQTAAQEGYGLLSRLQEVFGGRVM
jgi:hypothetical protein